MYVSLLLSLPAMTACVQKSSRVLAYKVRIGGSPQQASAASDGALPIEGLEELHSQHGGLLVIALAVQWGRY